MHPRRLTALEASVTLPDSTLERGIVPREKLSVLIVDDDREMRDSIRDVLEEENYEVRSAENGSEALALLTGNSRLPNLILLDWNMPMLDGEGFLREKGSRSEIAGIPTIVISATAPPSLSSTAAVIQKPFDLTTLLTQIARHARK